MQARLLSFLCLVLACVQAATASTCLAFDSDFNLYAFGTKDVSLGTKDTWTNPSVTASELTTSGRPPFNSNNVQCFLSQFYNALYVLGGDSSNLNAVHIFDFNAKSWSTQPFNGNGVDPNSLVAILDRDTNVFFGLSGGSLYQLDMGSQVTAQSSAISWDQVGTPDYPATYNQPVLGLANNHIHFLNMPSLDPGVAAIFVIHFAYFQPERQSYPSINSDPTFPVSPGKAVSFFRGLDEVQHQFAYMPQDSSRTYVIDVIQNSTTAMATPSDKSSGSVYAASRDALVQLTSSGSLYFLPFNGDDNSGNPSSSWQKINYNAGSAVASPAPDPSGSGSGSGAGSGAGSGSGSGSGASAGSHSSSATASHSSSASKTSSSSSPSHSSNAASLRVIDGWQVLTGLFMILGAISFS